MPARGTGIEKGRRERTVPNNVTHAKSQEKRGEKKNWVGRNEQNDARKAGDAGREKEAEG